MTLNLANESSKSQVVFDTENQGWDPEEFMAKLGPIMLKEKVDEGIDIIHRTLVGGVRRGELMIIGASPRDLFHSMKTTAHLPRVLPQLNIPLVGFEDPLNFSRNLGKFNTTLAIHESLVHMARQAHADPVFGYEYQKNDSHHLDFMPPARGKQHGRKGDVPTDRFKPLKWKSGGYLDLPITVATWHNPLPTGGIKMWGGDIRRRSLRQVINHTILREVGYV